MTTALLALVLTLHPLEREGVDHLYNLEFQAAVRSFEQLARAKPESAAGPYYLASTLWMEELTRRGGMTVETFQSSRYWTRTRKEDPSPALVRRFQGYTAEARNRAGAALSLRGGDREALYFLGATDGVTSAFEATIRGKFFAAYRAGRRARKAHERLIKLYPSLADAYLMPGVYEYAMATLPRTLRVLGFLIGMRGSKEKAARFLRKAAEGGRTYWGARLSLVVVETREKRYHRALAYLRELESSFPKNPLFPAERGWVHLLEKDWQGARSIFERIRTRQRLDVPHYDRLPPSVVLLRLGESLLFDARFERSLERFETALSLADVPATVRARLHLRRGQAYDGLHRRREAEAEYRKAIRLDADKASRRQAKRYLKKPFRLGS